MSSRFVSSGAIDTTSGAAVENAETQRSTSDASKLSAEGGARNKEAWEAVQREVEEERRRRASEKSSAEGAKSLYEILQENKAAKQAAFEEKNKIRNQFRALDDDEIEFLDDVERSKREEEGRLRRETEEGLRAFREAQKGGNAAATGTDAGEEVEDWGVGRKRKRKEKEGRGGIRRRVSSGVKEAKEEGGVKEERRKSVEVKPGEGNVVDKTETTKPAGGDKKPKLGGLVDYGSDESE